MEEQDRRSNILPEVALIAVVLIISGISGFLQGSVKLSQLISVWPGMPLQLLDTVMGTRGTPRGLTITWEILKVLLATASIVCGVGLLRQTRWARPVTRIVLLGLFGLAVVFPLLQAIISNYDLLQIGFIPQAGKSVLVSLVFALLNSASYLVMLLFLLTPSVHYTEDQPPNHFGRFRLFAEKVRGYLPSANPLVVSFIALFLISSAIPMLWPALSNLRQPGMQGSPYLLLSQILAAIFPFGAIVSGVGLLVRAKWSRQAALYMLLIGFLIPILTILSIFFMVSLPISTANIVPVIASTVPSFVSSIVYAVLVWYLLKYCDPANVASE